MLVGVFRSWAAATMTPLARCPHARGGVPDILLTSGALRSSCPHARGGVPLRIASQ